VLSVPSVSVLLIRPLQDPNKNNSTADLLLYFDPGTFCPDLALIPRQNKNECRNTSRKVGSLSPYF